MVSEAAAACVLVHDFRNKDNDGCISSSDMAREKKTRERKRSWLSYVERERETWMASQQRGTLRGNKKQENRLE